MVPEMEVFNSFFKSAGIIGRDILLSVCYTLSMYIYSRGVGVQGLS